jgi:membrane protease YdiL (CAAX protease family)
MNIVTKTNISSQVRRWLVGGVVVAAFVLCESLKRTIGRPVIEASEGWSQTGWLGVFSYAPRLLVPFAVVTLLFGLRQAPASLGLDRSPLTGILFAAAMTAPMGTVLALTYTPIPAEALPYSIVRGALAPGLTEEIVYRGFLFGLLFRFAGVGFLPAALSSSVIFGFAHYAQGGNLIEVFAVAGVTGFGGLWFAWLFVEWRFNVWVPVGLHTAMNAWWEVFAVSDTALGSPLADLSRMAVIVLSILVTTVLARRRRGLVLTWRSLLWAHPRSPW